MLGFDELNRCLLDESSTRNEISKLLRLNHRELGMFELFSGTYGSGVGVGFNEGLGTALLEWRKTKEKPDLAPFQDEITKIVAYIAWGRSVGWRMLRKEHIAIIRREDLHNPSTVFIDLRLGTRNTLVSRRVHYSLFSFEMVDLSRLSAKELHHELTTCPDLLKHFPELFV